MDSLQLKMCDVQGRLFELSADRKYSSSAFIKAFMTSSVAKSLDSSFNHMQWAGEEYLIEEIIDCKHLRSNNRSICTCHRLTQIFHEEGH